MQDEINEKVVALSVKGAKLTAETLQKAIKTIFEIETQKVYSIDYCSRFSVSCTVDIFNDNTIYDGTLCR